MLFDTTDKYLIKRQAWLEAIRLCGGVSAYSRRVNILRSRVSNWINQSEIEIPYEFSFLTWAMTQVSIDRLSPFTESANKVVKSMGFKRFFPVELSINNIIMHEPRSDYILSEKQSIIVDTDGLLISGLGKIKAYQERGVEQVQVIVLDIKSLLLEMQTLEEVETHFLISERVAIGLRMEQLLGNRQGQRSDLGYSYEKIRYRGSRRICDEVSGRTDEKIAKLLNFNSKDTYRRAQQVYVLGIPELIHRLDSKQLSIAMAAKIAKLSKNQQLICIQQSI